jgi:hypothetical protein
MIAPDPSQALSNGWNSLSNVYGPTVVASVRPRVDALHAGGKFSGDVSRCLAFAIVLCKEARSNVKPGPAPIVAAAPVQSAQEAAEEERERRARLDEARETTRRALERRRNVSAGGLWLSSGSRP